jgi:peptidoglycan biosynthesis protein MviN/MurJ (putative lipid II flippase)
VAGAGLLIVLLRRRIGGLSLRPTIRTFVLVTLASAVLAAVSYGVWWACDQALGRAIWAQVVSLGAGLGAGGLAYLISCRLLGVRELEALLSLRARFRRA